MASTISSLGIGSGLDANSIVTKLMALEQQPLTALNAKTTAYNAKLSSFGQLKSALSALQTTAQTLADPSKLASFTATAADTTIVSAQASAFASAGSYNVEVLNLATAQKRFSATTYASNANFGSGTLTFTVNNVATTPIDLSTSNTHTLNDVRAAINAANVGVTATVVSGSAGDRLILTASTAGTAGAFSLNVTSSDSNLLSLANFDLGNTFNANAQDALVKIDGESITSSTNTLSTAVNGLTINLSKVGTTQLTVTKDTSTVSSAVAAFVKNYNDAVSRIKADSTYDTTTKTGKPLNAESTVRTVMQLLNDARSHTPASLAGAKYETLSSLGISIQKDGSMLFDSTKLGTAVSASFADVQKTLGAYGTAFSDAIDKAVGSTGLIANRVDGINRSVKLNASNIESLQLRLVAIESRYRAQFTALDKVVASLQTTSSYLTQQFK